MDLNQLVDFGVTGLLAFLVLRELRWFRKDTATALNRMADGIRDVAVKQAKIDTKLDNFQSKEDAKVIPWNGQQR